MNNCKECDRLRSVMLEVAENARDIYVSHELGMALGETGCMCSDNQSCPTCISHPGAKGDPTIVLIEAKS